MTINTLERFFHWTVALLMIGLLGAGLYMEQNNVYSLYPIHKSLGILALLIILPRVVNRMIKGWPEPVDNSDYAKHEIMLSKVIHWVLIIGTVLMPISGMMMSGAGGHGLDVFGLQLLAENTNAAGQAVPLNEQAASIGHQIHGLLGKILIACIALHVIGAFKHHLIDKDDTLKRMIKS